MLRAEVLKVEKGIVIYNTTLRYEHDSKLEANVENPDFESGKR